MALLDHRWEHFAGSKGATPPERLRLPTELAGVMRALGLRRQAADPARAGVDSAAGPSFSVADLPPDLLPPRAAKPLVQRSHTAARQFGLRRGSGVVLRARYGPAPVSAVEFESRPIAVEAYVITPGAARSPLATAIPALARERFWVWRVLRIIPAGSPLPANSRGRGTADVDVFEAQVYAPARPGLGSPWHPCWDKLSRKLFLCTRAEKVRREIRKSRQPPAVRPAGSVGSVKSRAGSEGSVGSVQSEESVHEPLCAFLRAMNVYGSGFFLTGTSRVPKFVQQYVERRAQEEDAQEVEAAAGQAGV